MNPAVIPTAIQENTLASKTPAASVATKIQIRSRWNSDTVLFECDAPEGLESGMHLRHALEKATMAGAYLSGADLSGADLSGADLRGANLRGAYLRDADLRDAYLSGADLSDAYLRGADGKPLPRATPEQAIESLDKVRAIVLDSEDRLNMGHWHGNDEWRNRTCAEESICGTTHCLAGWLQVCSTEPALKTIEAQLAGTLAAPVASKMFFRGNDEALEWLRDRKYVAETAEAEERAKARAARRAAEGGAA